jgi:hypothetical protein
VKNWVKEGQNSILFDLNLLNASLVYFDQVNWGDAPGFKGRKIDVPPSVFGQAKIVLF